MQLPPTNRNNNNNNNSALCGKIFEFCFILNNFFLIDFGHLRIKEMIRTLEANSRNSNKHLSYNSSSSFDFFQLR
jgi:hypothetical protein